MAVEVKVLPTADGDRDRVMVTFWHLDEAPAAVASLIAKAEEVFGGSHMVIHGETMNDRRFPRYPYFLATKGEV